MDMNGVDLKMRKEWGDVFAKREITPLPAHKLPNHLRTKKCARWRYKPATVGGRKLHPIIGATRSCTMMGSLTSSEKEMIRTRVRRVGDGHDHRRRTWATHCGGGGSPQLQQMGVECSVAAVLHIILD